MATPWGLVAMRPAGRAIDRARCDPCGRCAEECPAGALEVVGKAWPLDELVRLLLRDESLYRASGGGVTLSGGEATRLRRRRDRARAHRGDPHGDEAADHGARARPLPQPVALFDVDPPAPDD